MSANTGDTHAIIQVLELPPSEFRKIRVNFESLYGMWFTFPVSSVKAAITFPNAKSPMLMLIPSFIFIPSAPVLPSLSDPARSTKQNLEQVKSSLSFWFYFSKEIVKIAWDLELVSFIFVDAVERLLEPLSRYSDSSSPESTLCSLTPTKTIPPSFSSRKFTALDFDRKFLWSSWKLRRS